jgi:predicted ester cyclase
VIPFARLRSIALDTICWDVSPHPLKGGTMPELSEAIDDTRSVLEAYWESHDPRYVAKDAVFTMMPTSEEIRGRDAIAQHLDGFYNKSLTAHAEIVNSIFGENKGLLEAIVVGTHTGEFGGVPATGRKVRVPLSVAYDVAGGQITKARIYLMVNILFDQITSAPPAPTES